MEEKKNIWTIVLAVIVLAILAMAMFTFTVQENTNAVVYTLGAVREGGIKTEPGLYFRWPVGVQRVVTVDTKERVLKVKGNEPVTTKDQNQIYLTLTVSWHVRDAELFIKRMTNDLGLTIEENAARFLQDRVRDARQRAVNQFKLSDIFSDSKEQPKEYDKFTNTLLTMLQKETDKSDYGIKVNNLFLTRVGFSQTSSKPIFDSMIEERNIRSQKNITDGKNEAAQIINRANLQKQNMVSQAMADSRRIKGEGDAAAAEFYKAFKANPQLANFLRKLDTLEEILKKKATVTLPSKNPLEGLIGQPPVLKSK